MKKILLILLIIIGTLLYLLPNSGSAFAQTQSAQIENTQSPTLIKNVEDLATPQNTLNQNQNINPQTLPMNTNPDVPQNLSTYTQSVFIEITSAASCLLSGVDPVRPDNPCLGFDPETKKLGYVKNTGGALGLMGGMIASTYNIPASSGEYVRYLARNFGITQNATAQFSSGDVCVDDPALCPTKNTTTSGLGTGNGFEGLKPLLNIWTAMRNIVYLLFVLVFIVLGLGIMFRIQIDPRAVMSIQSQLPKVVIALILVTFSYAIAGFLIDMMYLSLFLIINIFQAQGLETSTNLATNPINAAGNIGGIAFDASKGIAGVMTSLFDGTFGSLFKGIINSMFGALLGAGIGIIGGAPGAIVGGLIGGILGNFTGLIPGVGEPFTIVVGAIAWLIIIIALLSALFRLWFTLLKTYVFILINITFAPIWIAFGLIPGSSLSFGNWIRSLVSNLAAFPIVLILFSLGKTLQDGFAKTGSKAFVPPYIGDPGDMSAFASLIGMGIILLAPEAVNMAKAALKAPEFKYTSAIGRSIGVGQGVIGGGLGAVKKSVWYTNPQTGEAGRVKGWVGDKVSDRLDRIPSIKRLRDKLSTPEGRENRRKKSADKQALLRAEQERRDQALRQTTPPQPHPEPTSDDTG